MLNLKDRIAQVLQSFIPNRRVTIVNPFAEPGSMANRMTAEYIHDVIEAAKGADPRDLFALYRDILLSSSHLQGEFNTRKLALLGDALVIKPADKTNPDDVAAAKACEMAVDQYRAPNPGDVSSCPWLRACSHLLDGILWPVAIVEKVFKPSEIPGLRYELSELAILPEHLITYQTNSEDSTARLKIRDTDKNGYILGTTKLVDSNRYIIHRGHLLSTHDTWGGPMRSLLFWWLLATMDRDWWARFLERYGSPFLLGKYNTGDDESRSVLERAFSYAVKIGGLVVNRDTEVEIQQAMTQQAGEAYEKFIEIANREMSKLVVGRTMSSGQRSGAFGDAGKAKNEEGVRQDMRIFDALMLGQTLEDQLFAQFLRINGMSGKIKVLWGGESAEDASALAGLLTSLSQAGLEASDLALESISERFGFQIERAARPALVSGGIGGMPALSAGLVPLAAALDAHDTQNAIARASAAELSRAFRGSLAPVRRIIALSHSPEELEANIRAFYSDFDSRRTAQLIEEALIAFAANGATIASH